MVMNRLVYFYDELSINDALHEEGSDQEYVSLPERIPTTVRVTMEELAYRTAVWYTPDEKPFLHYLMTTNGIQVRKIQNDYSA
jgi:hypothetical protein